MTTLTTLVDRVQLLLNDTAAAIWAQDDVEEWVIDGIRDYSIHFPRTQTAELECVAGQQAYELPANFMAALVVEHPAGQSPPSYLTRLQRTHPHFWLRDTFYDLELARADATALSTLYLSALPDGTETTSLTYHSYHAPMVNTATPDLLTVTVPAYHEHIITQYAVWQAHVERLNSEIQSPDTTIRLIQQYKLAVQATEASYRASLRAALAAQSAGGWTGPWRLDGHDRIY